MASSKLDDGPAAGVTADRGGKYSLITPCYRVCSSAEGSKKGSAISTISVVCPADLTISREISLYFPDYQGIGV